MSIRIVQRGNHDCGVACLAMFFGFSYERIVELAKEACAEWDPAGPLNFSMQFAICEAVGEPVVISSRMVQKCPAIIDVISPTRPDWMHAVYWDGKEVYDPLPTAPVDRQYAMRKSVGYTQRLTDIGPLIVEFAVVRRAREIDRTTGLESAEAAGR